MGIKDIRDVLEKMKVLPKEIPIRAGDTITIDGSLYMFKHGHGIQKKLGVTINDEPANYPTEKYLISPGVLNDAFFDSEEYLNPSDPAQITARRVMFGIVDGIFHFVAHAQSFGIKVIMVWDGSIIGIGSKMGKIPREKHKSLVIARTNADVANITRLLAKAGIPTIYSMGEGEKCGSFLVQEGIAKAILTTDTDALVLSPRVCNDYAYDSKCGFKFVGYERQDILNWDPTGDMKKQEDLVALGMLLGNDFCERANLHGPVKVFKMWASGDEMYQYSQQTLAGKKAGDVEFRNPEKIANAIRFFTMKGETVDSQIFGGRAALDRALAVLSSNRAGIDMTAYQMYFAAAKDANDEVVDMFAKIPLDKIQRGGLAMAFIHAGAHSRLTLSKMAKIIADYALNTVKPTNPAELEIFAEIQEYGAKSAEFSSDGTFGWEDYDIPASPGSYVQDDEPAPTPVKSLPYRRVPVRNLASA